MSMIDFYDEQSCEMAINEAEESREELVKIIEQCESDIRNLDKMLMLLNYYLNTGKAIDPKAFGIEIPEDMEDD